MVSKEGLLDKIEEIGTIKRRLSLRDRARTSGYGLYVQSGSLPRGAMQYMAGGKFLNKCVFIRKADGTRIVKKHHPGDWELKVEVTLSLCRTLERLSKEQISWAPEKIMAYEAKEKFYYPYIAKVYKALQEHGNQLKNVWEFINTEQKKNLLTSFFQELEEEWPIESFEINVEEVYKAIRLAESVMNAYLVGYMIGKGWISEEEGGDNTLYLGDRLTVHIRSVLKGAQSKGVAFSTAFARVAAEGTMAAFTSVEPDKSESQESLVDMQAYEPSKYEILNEILLTEGTNLIRKSFKHPELLGQSTLSVSVNPFKPSDSEYLISAFLGGPSHLGHFDRERLEGILKKLLQDDYDKYYEAAKQRIIASH